MDELLEPAPPQEVEIDWDEARRYIRRRLVHALRGQNDPDIEDLVQEALVKLFRVMRREGVRNPKALMSQMARFTAVSFIRRKTRERLVFTSWSDQASNQPDTQAAIPGELGDPQELVELTTQEILRRRSPSCLKLWKAYLELGKWEAVALRLQIAHDAVRARWHRCRSALKAEFLKAPEFSFLRDWAGG